MGVWDEFYGSGKTGKRKARGKSAANGTGDDNADDVSGLQALIQQRQKARMGALVDSLAEKYGGLDDEEPPRKAGKKRGGGDSSGSAANKRRKAAAAAPDIDDAEFERLQQQMFGDKARR